MSSDCQLISAKFDGLIVIGYPHVAIFAEPSFNGAGFQVRGKTVSAESVVAVPHLPAKRGAADEKIPFTIPQDTTHLVHSRKNADHGPGCDFRSE